jgi:nucleoside-diphosphate-sugar epimerase
VFLRNSIQLYVNKNSIYNFVYIDDVVDALRDSLSWEKDVFNVASDENVKIIDIYDFLSKKIGKEVSIKDTNTLINIIGNNEKIKKKGWQERHALKDGVWQSYNYLGEKLK